MDNALSPAVNALPVAVNDVPSFGARLVALPTRNKVMMGGGLAVLAAAVLAITLWSNQGDYRPLFTGLSDKDGGAVIAQLTTLNIPYRNEPGGIILVPASQVYDLRMKLASSGLPKGGTVGFELMDKSSIGQTQFNERLNFQRGLEGELTRTITALADVADARVHLAMPQQNGFFREQQKPSASVMLTLRGGHTLDRAQIAGIVHLVSASVPELNPKAVSVLDQTGALLSANPDNNNGSGLDSQQLQYKQQIEANFNKRIYELLEPVVGRENLRATVTADVDFSQVESTAEEFKPNQGNAPASVRSAQTNESVNSTPPTPTGVPGAATNQPPVPATAPINGASAPLQGTNGIGNGNTSSRREATTNYEVDKTVRVTRNATGTVRRLNAAVVLNHRSTTDPKGKVNSVAVPQEELDKLTALVKETMGFSQERGDSLKIISAPFMQERNDSVELPLWKQPFLLDMVRAAAVPLALVLVALIAVFGMVRPAIRAANPPKPEAPEITSLDAIVDDENALPGQPGYIAGGANGGLPALEAPASNEKLERARKLARENPVAVANIMRGWIHGEVA